MRMQYSRMSTTCRAHHVTISLILVRPRGSCQERYGREALKRTWSIPPVVVWVQVCTRSADSAVRSCGGSLRVYRLLEQAHGTSIYADSGKRSYCLAIRTDS
jgi:hypothetical protein